MWKHCCQDNITNSITNLQYVASFLANRLEVCTGYSFFTLFSLIIWMNISVKVEGDIILRHITKFQKDSRMKKIFKYNFWINSYISKWYQGKKFDASKAKISQKWFCNLSCQLAFFSHSFHVFCFDLCLSVCLLCFLITSYVYLVWLLNHSLTDSRKSTSYFCFWASH